MKTEERRLIPGVQIRYGKKGRTLRYYTRINGRVVFAPCDLPIDLAMDPVTGRATTELKIAYAKWLERTTPKRMEAHGNTCVPTIAQLIKAYEEIAMKRAVDPRYNKPSKRARESALKYYRYCYEAAGLSLNDKVTELFRIETTEKIVDAFMKANLAGPSVRSYVVSLQTVTTPWALEYYRRTYGYKVPRPELPDLGKFQEAPSYYQLSEELDKKIDEWIKNIDSIMNLSGKASDDVNFYLLCINNLAMRPNDIGYLTAANFPMDANGRCYFRYKPHKTKESSNARVDLPIPLALWQRVKKLTGSKFENGELLLPNWWGILPRVNKSMREYCDMPEEKFQKAGYELRKRCIHKIMLFQGMEQAVRLSGDNRKTLEKYYTDPYKGQEELMIFE